MRRWEAVDERVLLWVASLPPTLNNDPPLELPIRDPKPFPAIEGLDTRQVAQSLDKLATDGLISGQEDGRGLPSLIWSDLRLTPRGLILLGEWPDLERVASAAGIHELLRQAANAAPAEERDFLNRAAGAVGRFGEDVVRGTIGSIASEAGGEIAS